MAEIRCTRRTLRDIRRLPPEVKRKIEITLDQLIDDLRSGDRLYGDWEGYWKLRTGDYRIIYRIVDGTIVEVRYVRHRREARRR